MLLFIQASCWKPKKPHKLPNSYFKDNLMRWIVVKMIDRSFWVVENILGYLKIDISVILTGVYNQLIQILFRDTSVTNNWLHLNISKDIVYRDEVSSGL